MFPAKIVVVIIIDALNSKGVEDPETKELLDKYVAGCQVEADMETAESPENQEVSNRANIKAQIKIATLLTKTRYKTEALESLNDAYWAASQNESTKDLAEQINALISGLES